MIGKEELDHVSRLLDAYCDVVLQVLELFKRQGVDISDMRNKCIGYTEFLWNVLDVYGEGRYVNKRGAVENALRRYRAL